MIKKLMVGIALLGLSSSICAASPGSPVSARNIRPDGGPLPMEMNMPAMGHEPCFLSMIDLTIDQKNQIDAIYKLEEKYKADLDRKLANARKALQALESNPGFDETKYRKAAAEVSQLHVEFMVLRAKTNVQVKNTLTDNQKNQLIQLAIRHGLKPPMKQMEPQGPDHDGRPGNKQPQQN